MCMKHPKANYVCSVPNYFSVIELKASGSEHILSLRMLDKQQGNRWVDGFSFSRNMILNAAELSQLKQINPDPWLTGFRESPYSSSDIDLLVKDLGQQLKCQLMKQSNIRSLYLDTTDLPETQSFENIIALLQSDLPMLTGLPLQSKKPMHNNNSQLILHLRWVLLNKQQAWGRLALSGSGTIGAWAYISGISQVAITAPEIVQNSLNVPVDNSTHAVDLTLKNRLLLPVPIRIQPAKQKTGFGMKLNRIPLKKCTKCI